MDGWSHAQVLDSLVDGVYCTDRDRKIVFWNKAAERITGFGREEVLGHCCADNILQHVDEAGTPLCAAGCPLAATLLDGRMREARIYLHHRDGHRVPVIVRVSPLRDAAGAVVGAVELFADDSSSLELLRELETLRQDVFVDDLTQVGNRRYGEMMLRRRLEELRARDAACGVVLVDVDRFKDVNDRFGHATGDAVLRMVSRTLINLVRRHDALARWGGEEFLILLPAVDAAVLGEVAERLRLFVARSFLAVNGERLAVTVSCGATLARPDDTADTLLARADALLYRSKQAGRNRVTAG